MATLATAPLQVVPEGRFRRVDRLGSRRDFDLTLRRGVRRRGVSLTVAVRLTEASPPSDAGGRAHSRLGLAVARGAGSAPQRARLRRLLREAFRALRRRWPALDLVVQARVPSPDASLAAVTTELDGLVTGALAQALRRDGAGRSADRRREPPACPDPA